MTSKRIFRNDYAATVTYSATSIEGSFAGGLTIGAAKRLADLGATIAVERVELSNAVMNVNTVQDAVKRLFDAHPSEFARFETYLHNWVECAYNDELSYRYAPSLFCTTINKGETA